MEKNAEIREGLTPPEQAPDGQKKAALEKPDLEQHITKQAADAVTSKPTK